MYCMDPTDARLKRETVKWLEGLEKEIARGIEINGQKIKKGEIQSEALDNILAYVSDCRHFLFKNDLVNAFEAVVYAWGIYETCVRLDLLRKK